MNAINQLCPACGLCCNGVLFADVELQPGDNAGRLIDLGMALKKKGMKRALSSRAAVSTESSAGFTPTGPTAALRLNVACSSACNPAKCPRPPP